MLVGLWDRTRGHAVEQAADKRACLILKLNYIMPSSGSWPIKRLDFFLNLRINLAFAFVWHAQGGSLTVTDVCRGITRGFWSLNTGCKVLYENILATSQSGVYRRGFWRAIFLHVRVSLWLMVHWSELRHLNCLSIALVKAHALKHAQLSWSFVFLFWCCCGWHMWCDELTTDVCNRFLSHLMWGVCVVCLCTR